MVLFYLLYMYYLYIEKCGYMKNTDTTKLLIHTHYIHNVVVHYFVSGRVCCVKQYHYESRKRRIVMRLVHVTGKNWYKVLYKHTMYVISLFNISIKTNFKQITRVEIRLTNVYNTLSSHWRVLTHIPMIWRHDKIVRQRRSRATSRLSFITTVWWYNILYQTGYFL